MKHLVVSGLLTLATLAGCATPPEPVAGADQPATPGGQRGGDDESAQTPQVPSVGQTPQTVPVAAAPSCDRALPPPGAAAHKEVLKILQQARGWLNDGEEDRARGELECAQQMEPDNKQVSCLLRGITTDLSAASAGDSTPYIVRAGDNLGNIAQRYLGDSCEFYLLARFNKMKYPKQLPVGQTIRLPGRVNVAAPLPQQPTPPQPVTPVPGKPTPVVVTPKPETPPPEVAKKPEPSPATRQAEIDRHYRRGQEEYRRQQLGAAIAAYDQVLAIDPNHSGARYGRQQAIELQEKLNRLKK